MTDFSIKEAENLCFKAARGAGYSWGMAEEAGFAAGWLAKRRLSDLSDFADCLHFVQDRELSELNLKSPNGQWASTSGTLCPVHFGAFLSDFSGGLDWDKGFVVANVVWPQFVLPFVSNASSAIGHPILVESNGFEATVHCNRVEYTKRPNPHSGSGTGRVKLSKTAITPRDNNPLTGRVVLPNSALKLLMRLAAETHVPETEELMVSGAGGEKVDDDD